MSSTLPEPVNNYLVELSSRGRGLADFEIDASGALLSAGGDFERLGWRDLPPLGTKLAARLPFLTGLLPVLRPVRLPKVSWQGGLSDVHAFEAGSSAWVLLLDASQEALEQQRVQQLCNEVVLERDRLRADSATTDSLLDSLDLVVFSRAREGFRLISEPPRWFSRILGKACVRGGVVKDLERRLLMLESFLEEAEHHWAELDPELPRLSSGPWVQGGSEHAELVLEALAIKRGPQAFLCIRRLGDEFTKQQQQLQLARDNRLLLDQLRRERDLREVLAHCLVHDLMTPLSAIRGALDLLAEDLPEDQRASMLATGQEAAQAQQEMIRDLLEVFQAEQGVLSAPDPAHAPALHEAVERVFGLLRPQAQLAKVSLQADSIPPNVRVLADAQRLERVLGNLLENAVRYSPRGSEVAVRLALEQGFARVSVEDEGQGIDPAEAKRVFEKFGQTGKKRGKAGLGLYFCRMMVERWGGEIGCEPREAAGSRFWFRLKTVDA